MDLQDNVVILTGAAGGIGRYIAERFAKEGAILVLVDRDVKNLEIVADIARQAGATVDDHVVDITDSTQLQQLVDDVTTKFGGIHVLVNNAGTSAFGSFLDVSMETWEREIAIHMTAPFVLTQKVAPIMIKQRYGRVINISSVAALMGPIDLSPYAAAKAGLNGLTRAMSLELAEFGITVNAVAPGAIETDLLRKTWPEEVLRTRAEHHPVGRIGRPEEVADAVMYFSSPLSGFVSGTVLPVDGGSVAAGAYMVERFRRRMATDSVGKSSVSQPTIGVDRDD